MELTPLAVGGRAQSGSMAEGAGSGTQTSGESAGKAVGCNRSTDSPARYEAREEERLMSDPIPTEPSRDGSEDASGPLPLDFTEYLADRFGVSAWDAHQALAACLGCYVALEDHSWRFRPWEESSRVEELELSIPMREKTAAA